MYTVGIIISSDQGYMGKREDKSGALIKDILEANGFQVKRYIVLPDEKKVLAEELQYMADELGVHLILTTGGTGLSKLDREAPGICEAIRYFSLKITKRAMLSRAVSGIRKNTIIVNLPGSPKACEEALGFVLEELKHGINILRGDDKECARR